MGLPPLEVHAGEVAALEVAIPEADARRQAGGRRLPAPALRPPFRDWDFCGTEHRARQVRPLEEHPRRQVCGREHAAAQVEVAQVHIRREPTRSEIGSYHGRSIEVHACSEVCLVETATTQVNATQVLVCYKI
eukprot:gene4362-biopygen6604